MLLKRRSRDTISKAVRQYVFLMKEYNTLYIHITIIITLFPVGSYGKLYCRKRKKKLTAKKWLKILRIVV